MEQSSDQATLAQLAKISTSISQQIEIISKPWLPTVPTPTFPDEPEALTQRVRVCEVSSVTTNGDGSQTVVMICR